MSKILSTLTLATMLCLSNNSTKASGPPMFLPGVPKGGALNKAGVQPTANVAIGKQEKNGNKALDIAKEDQSKAAAPNLGKLTEAQFKQEWTDYMQQRVTSSATDISWITKSDKTDLLRELAYQTVKQKPYKDVFYQDHEKEQHLFIVVRTMLEKAIQENKPMTAENAFEEVGKYLNRIQMAVDKRKPLVEKIQQEIAENGAKEQIIADAKEYIEHTDVLKFCQDRQKKLPGK